MLDSARPPLPPTATAPAATPLGAIYPALADLLGPEAFAAICAQAVARGAASDTPPGALIHGLLVRREARSDDRIPSRLAADIAALEWSIHRVATSAPRHEDACRAAPRDLPGTDPALGAANDAWRSATLQPAHGFDIVPVAFRLETWVRRAHQGRRNKRMPDRGEQHIVVHAPAFAAPLSQAALPVWWFALQPGPGMLLARLALGTPIGLALADAVQRGWVADDDAARAHLDAWLREGLFARVLPAEPTRAGQAPAA